jgi:radical S-adenosyl methionine domain-containing protein 2
MIDIITRELKNNIPVSVNWHLWPYCNAHCTFCFATFRDINGYLSENHALELLKLLFEAVARKISFAGGEPMLCLYLSKLIVKAKKYGITTMLITNGQKLSNSWLEEHKDYLDWLTISIDSQFDDILIRLKRTKQPIISHLLSMLRYAKLIGYRIKINTVVTSLSWQEDMNEFISKIQPDRWKVFQVLPVKGQNDGVEPLLISHSQFHDFVKQNQVSNPIFESNDAMTNSYVMIDPIGRFFDNGKRLSQGLTYSPPILSVGVSFALQSINFQHTKLLTRGGVYNWEVTTKKKKEGEK